MKLTYLPLRTNIPGKVPTVEEMERHGVAMNTYDKKLWVRFGNKIIEMVPKDEKDAKEVVDAFLEGKVKISF